MIPQWIADGFALIGLYTPSEYAWFMFGVGVEIVLILTTVEYFSYKRFRYY